MRYGLFIAFFIFTTNLASAQKTLLESYTESKISHAIAPPKDLIAYILASVPDDAENFQQCMAENNLKYGDEGKLFAVVKLSLNDDLYPDFFIRPTLQPYCQTFYGAHLFRYWFVTSKEVNGKNEHNMAFWSGGDGVKVLSSITNGYHDIQVLSHTAVELYTSTLKYNGTQYVESDCFVETFQDGNIVSKTSCENGDLGGGDNPDH
jgi:hypothetical protein